MGNCATKKKSSPKKYEGTELVNKPIPTKFTLSQTQLVYEAVLNTYIRKKSIPELGVVYMTRSGKSHISMTLLPGNLAELAESEKDAIIKLLEDYFISIGVNHELYINPAIDDPTNYKLYCHLTTFG